MTRRDYELTAATINTLAGVYLDHSDPESGGSEEYHELNRERFETIKLVAENLAKHYDEDNRAFDRERFLRDCGVAQ